MKTLSTKQRLAALGLWTAMAMGATGAALANSSNLPPPAGAILDLNGQVIPHGTPQLYTVDFTATVANTAITFAFREDPAYIYFSNASVVDVITGGSNLLTNGDFSAPGSIGTQSPPGWTYANDYGATFPGYVQAFPGALSGNSWYDGSVQAYDAISQTIGTTIGDTYQISFYATDNSSLTNWSALSTNGKTGTFGNGVDITVYAEADLPPPGVVPGPFPGAGFAGLAALLALVGAAKLRSLRD